MFTNSLETMDDNIIKIRGSLKAKRVTINNQIKYSEVLANGIKQWELIDHTDF